MRTNESLHVDPVPGPGIEERAAAIELILLDVDGVLTDGRIIVSSDGREARAFDVTDGLGIRLAQSVGLAFGIISGRESKVVARRAAELGISEVHQGILDKPARLKEILGRLRLDPKAVCFIGDDLIDVPAMGLVGLAAAPASARPEALRAAHFVTDCRGGRGAVRDLVELILRAQGKWRSITDRYQVPD